MMDDSANSAPRKFLPRILYGSSGLRAGWRALVFLILMGLFEWQGGHIIAIEHELFGTGESAGGWLFEKTDDLHEGNEFVN